MTNVFISWSGTQSKAIAEELRSWIPSVLQFAKPYFTPNDIEKGAKWGSEISQKLSESNVGVICLTKENYNKPWILFEAGALSKDLERSKVCLILFGMENPDLTGPLTTFQTTEFTKSDFRKLMLTINSAGEDQALNTETFSRVFDMWWPQLESAIGKILEDTPSDANETIRSDRELLEEILLLSRERSRHATTPRHVPEKLILDLLAHTEAIRRVNERVTSLEINDALKELSKITKYLMRTGRIENDDLKNALLEHTSGLDDFIPF